MEDNATLETSEAPAVINVTQEKRDLLDEIKDETGPLGEREWSEIYLLSVTLGYAKGSRLPLEGETTFLTRAEYFDPRQRWILNAIAANEAEGVDVIADQQLVWTIAAEYANSGIQLLYDRYIGEFTDRFIKKLERTLVETIENNSMEAPKESTESAES